MAGMRSHKARLRSSANRSSGVQRLVFSNGLRDLDIPPNVLIELPTKRSEAFEFQDAPSSSSSSQSICLFPAEMGSCLSKKGSTPRENCSRTSAAPPVLNRTKQDDSATLQVTTNTSHEQPPQLQTTKKGAIQSEGSPHSPPKSSNGSFHETKEHPRRSHKENMAHNGCCLPELSNNSNGPRSSSCTKEELDAILIHCGRLSRNSSGKGGPVMENPSQQTKHSGCKRSYDFDSEGQESNQQADCKIRPFGRVADKASPRTPSRVKLRSINSGSSHLIRNGSSGDDDRKSGCRRRSSRSPHRSETPTDKRRPAKIVTVPASAPVRKGTSIESVAASSSAVRSETSITGGSVRSSASPRSRSPSTNTQISNTPRTDSLDSHPSLIRSSSRKAENSPQRRTPMCEVDNNITLLRAAAPASCQQEHYQSKSVATNNKQLVGINKSNFQPHRPQRPNENVPAIQKSSGRSKRWTELSKDSPEHKSHILEQPLSCRAGDPQQNTHDEEANDLDRCHPERFRGMTESDGFNIPPSIIRASRRSTAQDVPMDPSFYSWFLMDDSHHHNKAAVNLPSFVSKACSILEAVADLNSCAIPVQSSISRRSSAQADGDRDPSTNIIRCNVEKLQVEGKKSLKSEVDLGNEKSIKPGYCIHESKNDRHETDQQESAGSNTFSLPVKCKQQYSGEDAISSPSAWEPNSTESTDRWANLSTAIEEKQQLTSATMITPDFTVKASGMA